VSALASVIHDELLARKQTVAVAESVTAGLVGAALTTRAGSSATYRGGLIVYATDLKATLAGVSADLLAQRGPVDPEVAAALAEGVKARLGASWGLSLTGVAGPDEQDGKPVGLLYVGLAGPGIAAQGEAHSLSGDRSQIRTGAVEAALAQLLAALRGHPTP
jgi:nicotinamide-nucleotide amidase